MLLLSLLLFCYPVKTDKDFQVELQPGHEKQDYDSVEEVRGHNPEFKTEKPTEDEHLLKEAILDVAYYLRRFKFSGFDPRYLAEGEKPESNLFVEFPSPPLRNIHWEVLSLCMPNIVGSRPIKISVPSTSEESDGGIWSTMDQHQSLILTMSLRGLFSTWGLDDSEVKKNCESSFLECVKYLQEQISRTVLPRHLDSLTITKQNGWSFITDSDFIKTADDECLKLLEDDSNTFSVFSGPLQKFQWLTSASYYMCYYTMRENPYLTNFTEDCDNFASCIDWEFGPGNRDIRSNNEKPFACALYSFCPDPCCPYKHIPDYYACINASPCNNQFSINSTCSFSKKENTNFDSLTLNQWNYSCNCNQPGMRWDSRSGMCVDIDECMEKEYPCCYPLENCRNLLGSYKCVCNPLGYRSIPNSETCQEDPILINIFYPPQTDLENQTNSEPNNFSSKIRHFFSKLKSFMMVPYTRLMAESNKTENP